MTTLLLDLTSDSRNNANLGDAECIVLANRQVVIFPDYGHNCDSEDALEADWHIVAADTKMERNARLYVGWNETIMETAASVTYEMDYYVSEAISLFQPQQREGYMWIAPTKMQTFRNAAVAATQEAVSDWAMWGFTRVLDVVYPEK